MNRILVTGGCGFIGSNFIRRMLREKQGVHIINLDKLTYAGHSENLADIASDDRYTFVKGDITDQECVRDAMAQDVDAVINIAAETHVDRSIDSAADFVETNVLGTRVLLDAARDAKVSRYIQVSTDEVYGSLAPEENRFTEESPLKPNSPYSASKTGADLLVRSYFKTYGLPGIVTRCSNNFGPYQFPEKLIPLFITNAINDLPVPLYGDGLNVRDWIHVEDHCEALQLILENGKPGEVYNIGGSCEKKNIEITKLVLSLLGKPERLIQYVKDRPGHDRRYAVNASKIECELGWHPRHSFEAAMKATVGWYVNNSEWVKKVSC